MNLNISSGLVPRAQKVVIYGAEGVGKTTLAAQFPNPLFIDTEGGTSHLDVRRVDRPTTWSGLLEIIDEVAKTEGLCSTLVLDTADWAEQLATTFVVAQSGNEKIKGIEDFGYGKGYTYLGEQFSRLLAAFDKCIAAGIHVVVTAHAKMRKFEQPDEMGAYDRWEMKLSKNVAPLLKEWADMVLFCNYKTFVVETSNHKNKVQGGKRVIYTTHHACWDAKNRWGLPDVIDMDYKCIAHCFQTAMKPTKADDLRDSIREMLKTINSTEKELLVFAHGRGKLMDAQNLDGVDDDMLNKWVLKYWEQIAQAIKHI